MTSLVLLFRGLCWSLTESEKGKRESILGREWSTRYVIGRAWILGERDKYTNFPCFIQIWAGFNAASGLYYEFSTWVFPRENDGKRIHEWEQSMGSMGHGKSLICIGCQYMICADAMWFLHTEVSLFEELAFWEHRAFPRMYHVGWKENPKQNEARFWMQKIVWMLPQLCIALTSLDFSPPPSISAEFAKVSIIRHIASKDGEHRYSFADWVVIAKMPLDRFDKSKMLFTDTQAVFDWLSDRCDGASIRKNAGES